MEIKKPFVKIFTNNNNFYMYDTNKNKILSLSSDVYSEISNYIRNQNYSSDIIACLKQKGYLQESNIVNLEHPYTQFVERILNNRISTLILQVTQNCNFRCRYCTFAYNSKTSRTHSLKTMSLETAQKCIDFIAMHCFDSDEITIAFYGGEPLLNFNLIKNCVKYSKVAIYNKPVKFAMTTNLYSATDTIIDFLAKNEFDLLISLDGPEHIQNNHRRLANDGKGTYKKVIENITKIRDKHPKYFDSHVRFNPVVYFDEDPQEILNFYKSTLNVSESNVQLQRIDNTGLNIAFDIIAFDISDSNSKQEDILFDHKTILHYRNVLNDKSKILPQYHVNGACVPGADKLFVSTNGTFFPCEKVNECNKCMQIGTIDEGFHFDKIKRLMNINYIVQTHCKDCWAIRFCRICCAHCDDGESSLSEKMFVDKCKNTQKSILKFFKNYINDKEYFEQ